MNFWKRGVLLVMCLTITACSYLSSTTTSPQPAPIAANWQQHQQSLAQLTHYQLAGKIAIFTEEERQSLNFTWSKQPSLSELRLNTFLGSNVMTLTLTPHYAQIKTGDGQMFSHLDAQHLIHSLTGLQLPVEKLEQWLIGLPGKDDPYTLNQNLLSTTQATFQGSMWLAQFSNYQSQSGYLFPQKIKVNQQNTRLNILINNWVVNQ